MKRKNNKLVIIGAGGSGKDVAETLFRYNRILNNFEILGFLDESDSVRNKKINGLPVLGNFSWLANQSTEINCVISNGFSKVRSEIVKKLDKFNVKYPTILDPSVIMAENVTIGDGTIIQAGTIINPDVEIGNHTFINLDCTIGHDCKIADFVTIAPGTHINGNNKIDSNTEVGSGSVTIQNIRIGRDCIIGAGTVIINNIPDYSLVVGNPGKVRNKKMNK